MRRPPQAFAKTARALVFRLIGSVQTPAVPRQAPVHARKRQPFAGRVVIRSEEYEGNAAEQRVGHEIPARELTTRPLPPTETESR